MTGMEQSYTSAGTALDVMLTGLTTNLDTRLVATEAEAIGSNGRVSTLEAVTAQATRDTVNLSNSIRDKISEIEARIGNQTTFGGTREKSFEGKPLMEYKMISDLGRLTNDKSGFRDWKVKIKDALSSVYGIQTVVEIWNLIEEPTKNGREANQ